MTRSAVPRRGVLLRAGAAFAAVIALAAGGLGLALVSAGAASASLGSVPAEVSVYVSSGAMVARLNDVYGPNASGTAGIKFDDTTKPGPISRVYEWTDARLANRPTDHPVQLTNNWVVPITIGGKSVGLATIWINPQTVEPELASFVPTASLGTALDAVPATAALVRYDRFSAWLALADGTVTPLVAGTSGLTAPVPVESLKLSPTTPAPMATTEPNTGLALAIGIVALIAVIIVVALLMPRARRALKKAAPDAAPASVETVEPDRQPESTPEPATAASTPAAPTPVATDPAVRKPATTKPAATKPATTKPAGPRPSGLTPTTAKAAKPATSKPTSGTSARSGPPVSKPATPKQPPRPRTPKPPSDSAP
ncbi:MAG: hypothetical protein ABJA11_04890 [Pseudolysinimonas sp.]